jgi:thiol-disulfide isomerase/thioredoxin
VSRATRVAQWAILALIVIVGVAVALRSHHSDAVPQGVSPAPARPSADAAADRAAARLQACPTGAGRWAADAPLRGMTPTCLADGKPVSLESALAGRPALLNLWAWWCEPCALELPALARYAARGGVQVLTVHSDPDADRALQRLAGLDVHLPGVEDAAARIRSAVQAPAVTPVSVLLRPDGTVAQVMVRPFYDASDIAAAVAQALGVS